MTTELDKLVAAAIRKLQILKKDECFDADNVDSVPTESQLEVLRDISVVQHRYCLGGNQSGKSQILRREVAWMFEGKHPYFTPPEKWSKDEPWTILVIGKTRRMIEDSLWAGIRKFLSPGSYKETKVGPHLEKVTNVENGNVILFLSHDNPTVAVDRIQSYTAHAIYLDEMPTSYRIVEELHRRGQVKSSPFLASFTPKSVNPKIKKLVEASRAPFAKKYMLSALDNPQMLEQDKAAFLESIKTYPESYQNTLKYGDWSIGEQAVYQFVPDQMICELPKTYHRNWRHVEASDPAVQSKFGLTLWAEDPADGTWYCILADYIEGVYVPELIFEEVMKRTDGYNIVRRVCDPHESWYIHTAASHGIHYVVPHDKNSRKAELIKGFQTALTEKVRITPSCEDLIEEISTCHWSENAQNKIVNASSYHLLDTAQYFVDCMPAYKENLQMKPWYATLREENQKRKVKAASKLQVSVRGQHPTAWKRRRIW